MRHKKTIKSEVRHSINYLESCRAQFMGGPVVNYWCQSYPQHVFHKVGNMLNLVSGDRAINPIKSIALRQ